MAPKLLQFIHKLFLSSWKKQVEYGHSTLSRRRRGNCVLKSVSSKSSLSDGSSCSLGPRHATSMDSINFEFRTTTDNPDLCCLKKCCEICYCEEGEAIAQSVRSKCRRKQRGKRNKSCSKNEDSSGRKVSGPKCRCNSPRSVGSRRSSDSACDLTSTSSCEDVDCCYREGCTGSTGGVPVHAFAHIHASACANADYETLTPKYVNVPDADKEPKKTLVEEPPYDFVPARPPRSITEPRYENVLTINCVDACVFRQISSLIDSTNNPAQVTYFKDLNGIH